MNWVLIRGLGRESAHWGDFKDVLINKRSDDRVHYIDLPGTGVHYSTEAIFSTEDTIDFIQSEFSKIYNQNEQWGIISISLGGMISLKWIEMYPKQFSNVVIINSSAANLSFPFKRLNLKTLGILGHAIISKDSVTREKRLLRAISNNPSISEVAANFNANIFNERPMKIKTICSQIYIGLNFKAPRIKKHNMLFLNSLCDRLADPKCSERLAKFYNSKLATHPTAGHDIPLDDPDWVIDQISMWMGS